MTKTDTRQVGVVPRPTRGYASGPHGQVHFHDTAAPGAGAALVLLHQSPASARQFEAAFLPLARRGIRSIAIDTPGFGNSDPTPFVPDVADWAGSIVAVLDHLGVGAADVLGHHTGSMTATEVALQFPARVRRLILNSPFPATAAERAQYLEAMQRAAARFVPQLDGSHLLRSFELRRQMYGPAPDPVVLTRGVVEKYQARGPFQWGHDAAFRYDHAAAMQKLALRTLILTNTGDDIHALAQRARAMFPHFEYRELEGGTHDIVDQQPEAWADAVAAFLAGPSDPETRSGRP